MGRESKISVPQGRSDSFPIRSRLVPGLVEGRVRVRVKTLASETVAFSLIPISGAFSVGEMPGFQRNGAWEELVIPNAIALSKPRFWRTPVIRERTLPAGQVSSIIV